MVNEMVLKNYLFSILYILGGILILSFITNILYYFDIISYNIVKYFKILSIILPSLFGGIKIGFKSNNKGYIAGFKLSLIFISILLIFSLFNKSFGFKTIFYFIIIIITIILGGMIGINKKHQ